MIGKGWKNRNFLETKTTISLGKTAVSQLGTVAYESPALTN